MSIVLTAPRLATASSSTSNVEFERLQNTVKDDYLELLKQLEDAGVIAPNLLDVTTLPNGEEPKFSFDQDTHWTPNGALLAGLSLREAVTNSTDLVFSEIGKVYDFGEQLEFVHPGVFAEALEVACDLEIPDEVINFPAIVRASSDVSQAELLFADVESDQVIVALGTSFSNGLSYDKFFWTDALRYSLQVDVENYGVHAGGVDTSFLGYLLADGKVETPNLIVWEIPWVTLRSDWEDELRQIYGTLHGACVDDGLSRTVSTSLPVTGEWTTLFDGLSLQDLLTFKVEGLATGRLQVRTTYSNGQTRQFMFTRSDRLPNAIDHPAWTVFLGDTDLGDFDGTPTTIEVKVPGQTSSLSIQAAACSSLF